MSDSDAHRFRVGVYGIVIETDLALVAPLPERAGAPDLYVLSADEPPDLDRAECVYAAERADSGLFRLKDAYVFRFAGAVDFYVTPARITYSLHDPFYAYGIELWLLGTVLAFWLEWQGRPALHASAVVVDGQAVGFVASNRGGKSSLATALMECGYPLLSDDILALAVDDAVYGQPGYPQMRMWPEQAAHFVDEAGALPRVHPYIEKRRVPVGPEGIGAFCDAPQPVRSVYLPDRRPGAPIEIRPVAAGEGLIELVRQSFVARLVDAVGWQPERLPTLARLAQHVPVRRLVYPDGVEQLPRVAEAIVEDVQALP